MQRNTLTWMVLITLIGCAPLSLAQSHTRYHHELRGKIVSVDAAKQEFTIKTNHGEVVECYLNSKSIVKREGKRIELSEVQAGERAYCHCADMANGKHLSIYLEVNEK